VEQHRSLLVESIDVLRKVVGLVKEWHPFIIDAMVILPEHLHAVWILPPGDADYSGRWMLIKTGCSQHIAQGGCRSASRVSKGKRGIWQRRYGEHFIRDEGDISRPVEYSHCNPVKHGHVPCAVESAPKIKKIITRENNGVGVRSSPQPTC